MSYQKKKLCFFPLVHSVQFLFLPLFQFFASEKNFAFNHFTFFNQFSRVRKGLLMLATLYLSLSHVSFALDGLQTLCSSLILRFWFLYVLSPSSALTPDSYSIHKVIRVYICVCACVFQFHVIACVQCSMSIQIELVQYLMLIVSDCVYSCGFVNFKFVKEHNWSKEMLEMLRSMLTSLMLRLYVLIICISQIILWKLYHFKPTYHVKIR